MKGINPTQCVVSPWKLEPCDRIFDLSQTLRAEGALFSKPIPRQPAMCVRLQSREFAAFPSGGAQNDCSVALSGKGHVDMGQNTGAHKTYSEGDPLRNKTLLG